LRAARRSPGRERVDVALDREDLVDAVHRFDRQR